MTIPNLATFGAIGDDATLNSSDLLSEFEWQTHIAGVGFIPQCAGAYRFPRSINATGVRLYGEGNSSKIRIISDTPTASISCWLGTPGGPEAVLKDFNILAPLKSDGSPTTGDGNFGISTHNQSPVIQHVRIDGHRIGIYIHDGWAFTVEDCYLTNMLGESIYAYHESGNCSSILKNKIFNGGVTLQKYGIYIDRAGGLVCKGNDIEGGWGAGLFSNVRKSDIGPNWSESMAAFSWTYQGCDAVTLASAQSNLSQGV